MNVLTVKIAAKAIEGYTHITLLRTVCLYSKNTMSYSPPNSPLPITKNSEVGIFWKNVIMFCALFIVWRTLAHFSFHFWNNFGFIC